MNTYVTSWVATPSWEKLRWKEERRRDTETDGETEAKKRKKPTGRNNTYQKHRKRDRGRGIFCFKRQWRGRQEWSTRFYLEYIKNVSFQILLVLWMTGSAISYHHPLKLIWATSALFTAVQFFKNTLTIRDTIWGFYQKYMCVWLLLLSRWDQACSGWYGRRLLLLLLLFKPITIVTRTILLMIYTWYICTHI